MSYKCQAVNFSLTIDRLQDVRIDALAKMAQQDRFVLDMLTAHQGGVCVMIGKTCCTYIPTKNDTHQTEVEKSLYSLQRAMDLDRKGSEDSSPWSWFLSGSWGLVLLRCAAPILIVFALFLLFVSCAIPCVRAVIMRAINASVVTVALNAALSQQSYQPLGQRDEPEYQAAK